MHVNWSDYLMHVHRMCVMTVEVVRLTLSLSSQSARGRRRRRRRGAKKE